MDWIRNASDSASVFNLHDPLLEKTLPSSSHDECFTISLQQFSIGLDLGLDVMLPHLQISVLNLHWGLGHQFANAVDQYCCLAANQPDQYFCEGHWHRRQVDRLNSV